ncbi:MAG: thiamine-monophosphate kinase [Planctomycetes bacterium]|nr:thiamine-monophosphate kinase [Planctomycetota bacterium]MBI3844654.1 thiamine-monophosphate kinase [Planctomycetota bacterium]
MRRSGAVEEATLVAWMRRHAPKHDGVRIGIGDDAALVRTPPATLVTTDMLLDGVHFVWGRDRPAEIGWKAIACNLSDIAAMGGRPEYALVSVGLPSWLAKKDAEALHQGMLRAASRFGVRIVGGDTNASLGGVVVSVTVLGSPTGRPVTRAGAHVGDAVCVTGSFGGSIRGRHLRFVPRVEEALVLARGWKVHAMMDVTDGLLLDASRLARESRVGIEIDAPRVPIARAARDLARDSGRTPLEHALSDGEDFELLFTLPKAQARRLESHPPFRTRITQIGVVVRRGLYVRDASGNRTRVEPRGYEHFKRTDRGRHDRVARGNREPRTSHR